MLLAQTVLFLNMIYLSLEYTNIVATNIFVFGFKNGVTFQDFSSTSQFETFQNFLFMSPFTANIANIYRHGILYKSVTLKNKTLMAYTFNNLNPNNSIYCIIDINNKLIVY